jgi:predicted Zn-dependent peptidase
MTAPAPPGPPGSTAITVEALDGGLRLLSETVTHVRSVTVGVWLARGSRHEPASHPGIAHFVEHMLFKGTQTRSAEQIAQAVDSIGGQLDAFTAKEYAAYYVKVLDEHLPIALDILADLVRHPAFDPGDVEREKKVILEEIKMVEDTPDDLVHEIFSQNLWGTHPLGRAILGTPESVEALTVPVIRDYFEGTYTADQFIVSAVGNVDHARLRDLVASRFDTVPRRGRAVADDPPAIVGRTEVRAKDLEQSHVCLGASGYPHAHADRHASYVLNTLLGGSMSSRLFQHVREQRGLAYAIFSGLAAYRDAGALTVYAGCANESVAELVDLVVAELAAVKRAPVPEEELRRAKDHLKGSLMLGLENTASRMSHLARQEIYFGRQFDLDETLDAIESVTADDVMRVAVELFADGALSATVLGPLDGWRLDPERLVLR